MSRSPCRIGSHTTYARTHAQKCLSCTRTAKIFIPPLLLYLPPDSQVRRCLEGAHLSFGDIRIVDSKYACYRITVVPRAGARWEVRARHPVDALSVACRRVLLYSSVSPCQFISYTVLISIVVIPRLSLSLSLPAPCVRVGEWCHVVRRRRFFCLFVC